MPEILQKYAPVTAERLKKPEDGNWLLFRRTYDGWGYSPLEQITPDNVSRLQPVWSFATGQIEGHQAPPIVNNGVMFVATPGNQVLAHRGQDRQCAVALQASASRRHDAAASDQPRRRALRRQGLLRGRRLVLVALDAKTGKEVWTAKVDDYKNGYYMSLAPLVVDGKVMVGARAASSACAASSPPSMRRPARSCGGPTRFRRRASPAARPGRRAAITTRAAAARSG